MPKPKSEIWGETLREIGILLIVFVPIEVLFRRDGRTWVDALLGLVFLIAGALALRIGAKMEAK